ncbi:DNA mismatch repair endonuclease MutL [Psittacicella hinzii]|uniref:DNA mismatch repair protein MutL n=1 Tax=Psittacicella hinzii TaxID=2028575 RepID=A0A3A1YNF8_9GAMM|nr:DNA mismatch repair endonuclease MutL [Psittacicella hinzii]RIY38769.1 hypothetical protein CKF58_03390 [Psittacicella hinzii]
MALIQVLPIQVANQIAAGEVVERPASIVKELVENSIDARATSIVVDINDGGKSLIRIRDNGSGIPKEQLDLALAPHATSKLRAIDDLATIVSYGFRGEALASISSVAKLTLTSHAAQADMAWQIYNQGKEYRTNSQPVAHPKGTTVEVAELFYNTPARQKFLKSSNVEFNHIEDLVSRMAIVRPHIDWTLTHNGKQRLRLPALAKEQYRERIMQVLPSYFSEHCIALKAQISQFNLRLELIVDLSSALSNKSSKIQYSYINDRMIKDKVVISAVKQAFEELFNNVNLNYILFLHIDSSAIDVNVHPAKAEVRFVDAHLVHSFIFQNLYVQLAKVKNFDPKIVDLVLNTRNEDRSLIDRQQLSEQDLEHLSAQAKGQTTLGFNHPSKTQTLNAKEQSLSSSSNKAATTNQHHAGNSNKQDKITQITNYLQGQNPTLQKSGAKPLNAEPTKQFAHLEQQFAELQKIRLPASLEQDDDEAQAPHSWQATIDHTKPIQTVSTLKTPENLTVPDLASLTEELFTLDRKHNEQDNQYAVSAEVKSSLTTENESSEQAFLFAKTNAAQTATATSDKDLIKNLELEEGRAENRGKDLSEDLAEDNQADLSEDLGDDLNEDTAAFAEIKRKLAAELAQVHEQSQTTTQPQTTASLHQLHSQAAKTSYDFNSAANITSSVAAAHAGKDSIYSRFAAELEAEDFACRKTEVAQKFGFIPSERSTQTLEVTATAEENTTSIATIATSTAATSDTKDSVQTATSVTTTNLQAQALALKPQLESWFAAKLNKVLEGSKVNTASQALTNLTAAQSNNEQADLDLQTTKLLSKQQALTLENLSDLKFILHNPTLQLASSNLLTMLAQNNLVVNPQAVYWLTPEVVTAYLNGLLQTDSANNAAKLLEQALEEQNKAYTQNIQFLTTQEQQTIWQYQNQVFLISNKEYCEVLAIHLQNLSKALQTWINGNEFAANQAITLLATQVSEQMLSQKQVLKASTSNLEQSAKAQNNKQVVKKDNKLDHKHNNQQEFTSTKQQILEAYWQEFKQLPNYLQQLAAFLQTDNLANPIIFKAMLNLVGSLNIIEDYELVIQQLKQGSFRIL